MNSRSPGLRALLVASVCMLASAAWAQSPAPAASPKPSEKKGGSGTQPKTDEEKTLYALGMSIGRSLSLFSLTPEQLEFVRAGLYAQVKGEKPAVSIDEYGPKIQALATARQSAMAAGEKQKGEAFLEKAAKEKGAEKTASGLIYQQLKAGTGASPRAEDVVKVHYRGTLTDGKEFDSSYKRGEPASFPLNGVIRCWTEGVQKMKVGGKAKLVCPSNIAYGDRGAPPDIPGGAVLVFEIELLEVSPGNTPAKP
jgi:FKBP-type peptidyl-prolyl cis-trans isomerase FkpA